MPRRSVRRLHSAPPCTPDGIGHVGLRRYFFLVSIYLRPTGLRPVRARAFASVEYSHTSMSHMYLISSLTGSFYFTWIQWSALDIVLCFPPEVLRPDPSQEHPASAEVAATHRSDCNCWDIAFIIVWPFSTDFHVPRSACAIQPKFVNHLVIVLKPNKSLSVTVWNISGNLFMNSTTVGCSQLAAECECA